MTATSSLTARCGTVLERILGELTYPATKWQVMAVAERFGIGTAHRAELAELPAVPYCFFRDVLLALDANIDVPDQDGPGGGVPWRRQQFLPPAALIQTRSRR